MGGDPSKAPTARSMLPQETGGLVGHISELHGVGGLKIPVFIPDFAGSPITAYPCFEVDVIDVQPRMANFVSRAAENTADDHKVLQVGDVIILDPDLGEVTGPALRKRRKIAYPFDYSVELRAKSKDAILAAEMLDWLFTVFPPLSYLTVGMADGTSEKWDVEFVSYRDLDKREVVALTGEREYTKALTYRVEGYQDNTATARLETTGRGRNITTSIKELP